MPSGLEDFEIAVVVLVDIMVGPSSDKPEDLARLEKEKQALVIAKERLEFVDKLFWGEIREVFKTEPKSVALHNGWKIVYMSDRCVNCFVRGLCLSNNC